MGYTTIFKGYFCFDRPLSAHHAALLDGLARTRRYKRDVSKLAEELGISSGAALERYGDDAGLYYDPEDFVSFGQTRTASCADYNTPPGRGPLRQPGLWLKWRYRPEHAALEWDGGEKFYAYKEWLEWILLVINLGEGLWGTPYLLNGTVTYHGEDADDCGTITVQDNKVIVEATWELPEVNDLPPPLCQ